MANLRELLEHCRDRQAFYMRQSRRCIEAADETDDASLKAKREEWSRKKFAIALKWDHWARQLAKILEGK